MKINQRKVRLLLLDLVLLIVLVIIDQYTKYAAVIHLKNKPAFSILDGILEFNYLENYGAAFGMLQNQKIFFVFVALIFLGVILFVLFRAPADKKYDRMHILLVLIAGGAIGNLIDRLRFDYVVDFIYIVLINFPIFNVADMYVTFSTVILVIQVLFVYKEKDFNFLSFDQKKYRELK